MRASDSYFRTIEVGQCPVERGQLKFVTVKSDALLGRGDLTIYIPALAEIKTSLPVVILLHGVYGSHWVWAFLGNAHLTLQRLIDEGKIEPMILAMPSDGLWGDGSGYMAHSNRHFDRWIIEDVPQAVAQITDNPLSAPHFIAGLSMGGYGALRLGAANSNRFKAFSGHSSITQFEELSLFVEEPLKTYESEKISTSSVWDTLIANQNRISPFRFDCGVDDILIGGNRKLNEKLQGTSLQFSYEEFKGGHTWDYWSEHIEKTFRFFSEQERCS